MNRTILFRVGALMGLLSATLHAQVPQIINYQGRVVVGTTNFDGAGQFKFALVDAAGTTTYWSNDNTSTAGSEPAAAVALTVSKGLYSVLLGDATIPNMVVVPAGVFTNSDVRLRVWFNDGTNGSQLLVPDQRIAAVGYALMAGGVNLPVTTGGSEGVITQNGTRLLHTFGPASNNVNFFAGPGAGNFTMTGNFNTAIGTDALRSDTTGGGNTALGRRALQANAAGGTNTALGHLALESNTEGTSNTAVGVSAARNITTGGLNIALGVGAGTNLTTGDRNIDIGNGGVAGESDIIRIGTTQTDTFLTGVIHGNGSALTGVPTSGLTGTITSGQLASGLTLGGTTTGTFTGSLTGSVTGNAATATALQTGRTINGILFNGTSNITVPAAAGTLTGSALASGVTGSSLTSVGTLTSLTTSGTILAPTGSASAPAFTFSGDTNTGMFRSTADTLNFTTGGVSRMSIDATGVISGDGSGLTLGQSATLAICTSSLSVANAAAFAVIPGLTQTFTVPANTVIYIETEGDVATTSVSTTGFSATDIRIFIDGFDGGNAVNRRVITANTGGFTGMIGAWTIAAVPNALSAGTHTIDVRARGAGIAGGATATVGGNGSSTLQGRLNIIVLKP